MLTDYIKAAMRKGLRRLEQEQYETIVEKIHSFIKPNEMISKEEIYANK